MPVTDPVSDLLTRIRNAGTAKHKTTTSPYSNLRMAVARILKEQGFIAECEKVDEGYQGILKITLRYYNNAPVIKEMIRVSKPGRRYYAPVDKLPRVNNGLGVAIISTSKGVMTDKSARKENVGGEVLCTIW